MQSAYEEWLRKHFLHESVIGYRAGLGSNVDLAAGVFSEVAVRKEVTCLCFDISDFFPTICHKQLKKGLKEVLDVDDLPPDWFDVYKSICAHTWVELKQVGIVLGFQPSDPPPVLADEINSAMKLLRSAKLLHSNKGKSRGIPQGTPISAAFANVAMAEFDQNLHAWATQHGATYRRYSDDILLIVPPAEEASAASFVQSQANACGPLVINPAKTEVSRFSEKNGQLISDHQLTYLGFTYNGQRVEIRGRTLSRYYRRMTYAVRGTIRGAGRKGKGAGFAFRRSLYKDLTHLGSSNFYTYASKADKKLAGLNSIVKRQLKRHFKIVLRKLENRGR